MKDKLYRTLAQVVGAYIRCKADAEKGDDGKREWMHKHRDRIHELTKAHMPSGSGFDAGTNLDLGESTEEKLIFHTSFHHMDDGGMYDGWTTHKVVVIPSLAFNYRLRIGGVNKRDIKTYISDTFHECLDREVE